MNTKPLKILLIEDNLGDARLIREMLKEAGVMQYDFDCADRLSTGLEYLAEQPPDIVLLDLGLPDSQGLNTLARAQAPAPGIPVVVLTGLDDESVGIEAVRQGAQDYLVKGQIHGRALWRVINYAAERKRAEKALRESEEFSTSLRENAPNPILVINPDSSIGYVNPAVERLTGYSKQELIGKKAPYPHWPKDKPGYLDVLKEGMQRGLVRRERRFYKKSGEPFWVEITSVNLMEDGKLKHHLSNWVDITERKKAEEALKESEEFTSSLLEGSPHPILVINPDGSFRYVNPALEKLTGYSKAELVGKKPPYPYWPKDEPEYFDTFKKVAQKETVRLERRFCKKTGEPFWVEVTSINVREDGKHKYLLSNWVDITERKKAEEALRASEERYRTTLGSMLEGCQIIDFDWRYIYLNDAAIGHSRRSREELLGRTMMEMYPGIEDTEMFANLRHCMEKRIPHRMENIFTFPDGSQSWFELSIEPVPEGIFILSLDITERKKAEEALRHAAEEWRTTFDSITDLVSIHDKDFRLVRVNKTFARAFKMNPEDVIGKHCYEVVHGTDEPVPSCPYKQTLETKKSASAEFFEPHLGIYLEVSTSPILNDRGEVVGCVHVARDITERVKMQEQLILTDRLASIGELASGIAHELNNPLTSVIGFSELLMEKEVPEDIKDDLKLIHREAQRTANVVKGLLTFARKHELVKQSVNIHDIIDKVLELRAYEQRVNNIQVITHFASDLPEVMADYFQLQQVFLNIVVNAEYFMIEAHGRGKLTITTERVGDMVRASFADDGPGMSEETLKHLFTPFYTTKPVGKGTGLGLSICHGIVTGHSGKIYAESKPGAGATFFIELPIGQAPTGEAQSP